MMTSSPGNADICDDVMTGKHFRHYWLFVDPVSNAEFYDLLDVSLNKRLKKKPQKKNRRGAGDRDAMSLMWRHCNS